MIAAADLHPIIPERHGHRRGVVLRRLIPVVLAAAAVAAAVAVVGTDNRLSCSSDRK